MDALKNAFGGQQAGAADQQQQQQQQGQSGGGLMDQLQGMGNQALGGGQAGEQVRRPVLAVVPLPPVLTGLPIAWYRAEGGLPRQGSVRRRIISPPPVELLPCSAPDLPCSNLTPHPSTLLRPPSLIASRSSLLAHSSSDSRPSPCPPVGVDFVQERFMGAGDQSNESAAEQFKDEQISDGPCPPLHIARPSCRRRVVLTIRPSLPDARPSSHPRRLQDERRLRLPRRRQVSANFSSAAFLLPPAFLHTA
jgi:hypothetical protein